MQLRVLSEKEIRSLNLKKIFLIHESGILYFVRPAA